MNRVLGKEKRTINSSHNSVSDLVNYLSDYFGSDKFEKAVLEQSFAADDAEIVKE